MRKILSNVSSIQYELRPYLAKPFTSQNTHWKRIAGWALIFPICLIAIISNTITG